MDEVLKLFGVMLAVILPVAVGGGVFLLVAGKLKRLNARRVSPATEELEELRARVEELEHGQKQLHELAERLDFVERVLPALREGRE